MDRDDIRPFIQRIKQIDQILKGPVRSLVEVVAQDLELALKRGSAPDRTDYRFPPFVETGRSPESGWSLTHGICCVTLQRIWGIRRRFPDLKDAWKRLAALSAGSGVGVPEMLARPFRPELPAAALHNEDIGALDPLTASQVLWVLLYAGEDQLHSPLGFTAFFALVKALHPRSLPFEGPGVTLGNAPPSAWVTAKCVSPLAVLSSICRRRADLFKQMEEQIGKLEDEIGAAGVATSSIVDARRRTQIPRLLERLAVIAEELTEIAIARDAFRDLVTEIDEALVGMEMDGKSAARRWKRIQGSIVTALRQVGKKTGTVMKDVGKVVSSPRGFLRRLETAYEKAEGQLRGDALEELPEVRSVSTPPLHRDALPAYWRGEREAVTAAAALTRLAHHQLSQATESVKKGLSDPAKGPRQVLTELAQANEAISKMVAGVLDPAVSWCDGVLTRQISHASARNFTEFDPSELISSMYVLVSQKRLRSDLAVGKAVKQSLLGHRGDGSWYGGQPFWSVRGFGMLPPTSDILWMLSDTLSSHPDVASADATLGAYVDWLDRTQKRVGTWSYFDGETFHDGEEPVDGWVSERAISERVDLWATAFAINALLGIRDLMEFRLSQVCERRFTVLAATRKLDEIDPVDAGTRHAHRLHRRLYRMARQSDGDDYENADYSLILHGPPGSSKTAVIEALSDEMWRHARRRSRGGRWARLIRITPADFTRLGEQRLDSEAALIFELLGRLRGVTILFDEIDDLLKTRDVSGRLRFIELVVPAMLNRLQDLRDVCPRQEIAFLLATNYVEKIEPALLRPGRIDRRLPVVYPDRESRRWMVARHATDLAKRLKMKVGERGAKEAEATFANLLAEYVDRLDHLPWKSIDGLLETVAAVVREAVTGSASGTRSKRGSSSKATPEQRLAAEIDQLRAELPSLPYRDRIGALADCPELRSEVLSVALATIDRGCEEAEQRLAMTEAVKLVLFPGSDEESESPPLRADDIDRFLSSRL